MSGSVHSPANSGSHRTARGASNAAVLALQAKIEALEAKVRQTSELEDNVEELTRQVTQLRMLSVAKSKSTSPTRDEHRRDPISGLTKKEKREILKKRSKILDTKEVAK